VKVAAGEVDHVDYFVVFQLNGDDAFSGAVDSHGVSLSQSVHGDWPQHPGSISAYVQPGISPLFTHVSHGSSLSV
jgi:hypothetical protein